MFDFFEGILQSLALAAWWKVVGIVGLGGIIAAGALAVAYFMPLLRKPAICRRRRSSWPRWRSLP
jgi:hypothetical protein